jgi:LacI family transcriptional regulator
MTSQRRANIRDIAAHAGVSVTTVSLVLNRIEGTRIAEETRRRVEESAAALGYAPNGLARGLRRQRSETLALLSDEIATTPYAGKIILGAQETASRHGWVLMVMTTGGDAGVEQREIKTLLQHRVDGVLYATMYHRKVDVPAELDGVPLVLLDSVSDRTDLPSVVPDEVTGGRDAAEELLRAGHRRIAFATNLDDIPATHGRLHGYRQALETAGITFDPGLVHAEASDTEGGHRAALALLDRADPPTALFCFNDRMAMGAYRAAQQLGLRIPADLSVVGFDDQEIISAGLYPGLTTMALPHYEMGAWSVDTLIETITSDRRRKPPPAAHVSMPCPLVRRGSVGPPSTSR